MELDLITDMCDQPWAPYRQMLEITPLSVAHGVTDIDVAQEFLLNLSPRKGCQAEFHCLVIDIVLGHFHCW